MRPLRNMIMGVIIALSSFYALTDSETSYTWRLDSGKIMPAALTDDLLASTKSKSEDKMLDILMSTVTNSEGMWRKTAAACKNCINNRGLKIDEVSDDDKAIIEGLDCGKPVNFTYYDHLVGIQNRASHPSIPEPEVTSSFKSLLRGVRADTASGVIDQIERKLKKAKRDKPKSVELYNQIGNFWRIKGDTHKSIECFRRALAVSPNNADILLNLARVLFNLQYLDDAIFLTRRSLEVQPPDQNAWMQHYQLGEILKAYCHYQEAALHLRHVLELKPNYAPAIVALESMESIPDSSVHGYTVLIIIILVCIVLIWILATLDIHIGDLWSGSTIKSEFEANGFKTKVAKYNKR